MLFSAYTISIPMQARAVMLRRAQILIGNKITTVFSLMYSGIVVRSLYLLIRFQFLHSPGYYRRNRFPFTPRVHFRILLSWWCSIFVGVIDPVVLDEIELLGFPVLFYSQLCRVWRRFLPYLPSDPSYFGSKKRPCTIHLLKGKWRRAPVTAPWACLAI